MSTDESSRGAAAAASSSDDGDSGEHYTSGGGGVKKLQYITSFEIEEKKIDMSSLGEDTRRFLDPADKRFEASIVFADHPYVQFFRDWLIMGIDSQTNVKCLIPIEETIHYTAKTHGGSFTVHGSNLSVYDAMQLLPIDQRLELDTRFSITVPLVELPYAKAIFSDSIVPLDKVPKGILPFNRRNYLLCVEPGESLSMHLRVGYVSNFSILERAYWWLAKDTGLVIGTQLSRSPIAYLKTIASQLIGHMEQAENNRFDYKLTKAGLIGEKERIAKYVLDVTHEIQSLDDNQKY